MTSTNPIDTPGRPPRADRDCTAPGKHADVLPLPATEREHAAEPRGASGRPAGLVRLATSDTRAPLVIPGSQLAEFNRRRRHSRMCRSLLAGAELQSRAMQREAAKVRCAFITLTYRPGLHWEPRHVSEALKRMRHWCSRRGWRLPYEWKAELQKRGAVHFHVVAWLPHHLAARRLDLDTWGWWPHGMTNFQWVRRSDKTAAYVSKYLAKAELARMPKGIRMHGRGGMDAEVRRGIRYCLLPRYIKDQVPPEADVVRAPGGGWLERLTGQWFEATPLIIDWSC